MTYRSALLGAAALMIAVPAFAGPTPPSYVPDLLPPNPVAGQCYGRVEIPARYETTTETVVTREAHERLMVQQAQLQPTIERVMVKEPSVRYVVRQPTYGTVAQKILTRPGYDKLSVSEPHFRTVTETLQQGQARLVWKRGNPAVLRAQGYRIHSTADGGAHGQGYRSTTHYGATGGQKCGNVCEIWCLVEEPAESVTVTRQVLSQPGQIHRTPVHPQYQTITKQVVTDPGGVEKIAVPGEYRDLHVEKLVRPASTARVNVPAEYGHAQGRKLVSEARYEWRQIACKPAHHTLRTQPQTHQTTQHHTTTQSHARTYSSGNQSYYSGTTTVPVQPLARSYTPSSTSAPLQGQLVQSGPAYISSYQSRTQQGGHYPAAAQPQLQSQAVQRSSSYPDRAYSGPAYGDPSQLNR